MTDQIYQNLKNQYIVNITESLVETGEFPTQISVFGTHRSEEMKDVDGVIHIPIPSEFMKSGEQKDLFMTKMLPQIAEKVKEFIIPCGIAWASEAWLRTLSKDSEVPENWKEIPIEKEVLIVNLDFGEITEMLMYEIMRKGKQVNSSGILVDHIELKEAPVMTSGEAVGGRFTGLYKKFISA